MMAMKIKWIIAIIFFTGLAISCSKDNGSGEVICSEEFRMVGLKVTGGKLTDFYTLRVSTGDTIRFTESGTYPLVNWYPVLDDNYQPLLEGTEEDFLFVGEIDQARVVEETFVIAADQCHIYKISGPQMISL